MTIQNPQKNPDLTIRITKQKSNKSMNRDEGSYHLPCHLWLLLVVRHSDTW